MKDEQQEKETIQTEEAKQTTESDVDDDSRVPDEDCAVNAGIKDVIEKQIDELRKEYLNGQSRSINIWLVVVGLIISFFAIAIPIVTGITIFFNYQRYKDLLSQAERSLQVIKQHETVAEGIIVELTSKKSGDPDMDEMIVEYSKDILENPYSSSVDRTVAKAIRLQEIGKNEEAIEKWKSIAIVVEGRNDNLAARALFSVGYLYWNAGEREKALSVYNEAVYLNPGYVDVYIDRGNVRLYFGRDEYAQGNIELALKHYESALADYERAILLKPDSASAYSNRGNIMMHLAKHESDRGNANLANERYTSALTDYKAAIRFKPDYVAAHLGQGSAHTGLGNIKDARSSFQTALMFARQQNLKEHITELEKLLQELDSIE